MAERPRVREEQLDHFDPAVREAALAELAAGRAFPPVRPVVNLHAHTFFSYNPEGYSPTHFAWLARQAGLEMAGIVDFDVLDGVDEFHAAGRRLGLKTVASIESRVFVPEFATRTINSPGEPGVAYHMGVGFVSGDLPDPARAFCDGMRQRAQRRTRALVERVNAFLDPVLLDYDADVAPLTPRGNATERHVCTAYARKAAALLPDLGALRQYWAGKLGSLPPGIDLPDGPALQGVIRSRTMKRGGVGYVPPDAAAFPLMAEMNRFVLEAGAIPTLAWLDGTSDGEQAMAEYIAVGQASGAAALNIIPDRNFTPGVEDQKLRNLREVVHLAGARGLPIIVGTELNSPGQRLVDDFDAAELAPLVPAFREGAAIAYAHSVLQAAAGLGYCSGWAARQFTGAADKNEFYAAFGARFSPGQEDRLREITPAAGPGDLLARL